MHGELFPREALGSSFLGGRGSCYDWTVLLGRGRGYGTDPVIK